MRYEAKVTIKHEHRLAVEADDPTLAQAKVLTKIGTEERLPERTEITIEIRAGGGEEVMGWWKKWRRPVERIHRGRDFKDMSAPDAVPGVVPGAPKPVKVDRPPEVPRR